MKKVRKAIIPAAGLGTRVLPASKAIPKEMLNIVDKPAMQYIVEEAFNSGIEEVLIITNRGKEAMEDHFDHAFELETKLEGKEDKKEILESVKACSNFGNIYFLRQKETGGLGHAVLCAKNFVGDEPFVVLYGDDVIDSDEPVTKQLIDIYEEYGKAVVGVKAIEGDAIMKYCSLNVEHIKDNIYNCDDMIEKPNMDEIMSNFSIKGRVLLPGEIFDILEKTPKGKGNELQLTDAMKTLAQTDGVIAVEFDGTVHDMGNKFGILRANIDYGLKHPEVSEQLKEYIKTIAKEL
jgi:UTP--glucose-1-phosphate uridylyltransferase